MPVDSYKFLPRSDRGILRNGWEVEPELPMVPGLRSPMPVD